MNNEINTMIELQHFQDNILRCDLEIERSRKSINIWENRLKEISLNVSEKESKIKELKMSIKKNELDLDEVETRIRKTEQRKDQLKSEREIEAQNNELIRLNGSKDKLEEVGLDLLDNLEKIEQKYNEFKNEFDESGKQVKSDVEKLQKNILELKDESDQFKKKFNNLIEKISPVNKSRFIKLAGSKDGVAIAKLNGEICSHCNFQVPASIAVSAQNRKKIEVCTNCGRFIY